MKRTFKKTRRGNDGPRNQVFTLDVMLLEGPRTERFLKKNRVVSRTIQMRGDQTLQELHEAIFTAFDRWDEHAYEFQLGGKGPKDPKARRYVLPCAMREDPYGSGKPAGDVTRTAIDEIGLKKNDAFGYWFDFGDDWWHQINVVAISNRVARGKYPRVTARVGQSPPQYLDPDDESAL